MAERNVKQIVDDFDGSYPAERIHFAYRGTQYVVDLSPENVAEFDELMGHYVAAGRKYKATPKPKSDAKTIRAWAAANGVEVTVTGIIPKAVREAYEAAQG